LIVRTLFSFTTISPEIVSVLPLRPPATETTAETVPPTTEPAPRMKFPGMFIILIWRLPAQQRHNQGSHTGRATQLVPLTSKICGCATQVGLSGSLLSALSPSPSLCETLQSR
jgi:hypothetical protein